MEWKLSTSSSNPSEFSLIFLCFFNIELRERQVEGNLPFNSLYPSLQIFFYVSLMFIVIRMALILRDWIECPQDHEFRCFVHNRHLNAISQYHCYTFFDKLQVFRKTHDFITSIECLSILFVHVSKSLSRTQIMSKKSKNPSRIALNLSKIVFLFHLLLLISLLIP